MKESLLLAIALTMAASTQVLAQGSKWGGAEPAPAVKGTPGSSAPVHRDGGLFSCFAHRAPRGNTWQIECSKGRAAACEQAKATYVGANRGMEVIGCAPSIACFAYNPGGTSSSCYVDMAACNAARAKLAQSGGNPANLGNCVANQASGSPVVAMPTATGTAPGAASPAPTGPKACFAATFGPGRVQIRCFSYAEDCPSAANRSTGVILGCSPAPLFCFAYNGNTSGACFTEKQACVNAQVRLTNQTKPGSTGFCYQYDGDGVVSM